MKRSRYFMYALARLLASDAAAVNQQFENRDKLKAEVVKYCTAARDDNGSYDEDTYGPIENWNVSGIDDMSGLFSDFRSDYYGFGEVGSDCNPPIGDWDVSSVKSFYAMFRDASSFNEDIGSWDVASVKSFAYMFYRATSFDQDISLWDVSSSFDFLGMFNGATSFDQDIGSWDVSSGQDFYEMFNGAASFEQELCQWPQKARDSCVNGAICTCTPSDVPSHVPSVSSASKDVGCYKFVNFCMTMIVFLFTR